jgi:hypothetical protein
MLVTLAKLTENLTSLCVRQKREKTIQSSPQLMAPDYGNIGVDQ